MRMIGGVPEDLNMATPTAGDDHQSEPYLSQSGLSDFEKAQREVFEEVGLDVQSRFIDLDNPPVRTHFIDTGNSNGTTPLLFIHGTVWFAAYFAPLMAELDGNRMIAIDRPGWGLSGDFRYTSTTHRRTASNVLVGVLDELGIDRVDLVGNSTGGFWSIAFALAHPDRVRHLILLGGVATFPGTKTPLPTRLLTIPGLNRLMARLQEPSEEAVVQQMEGVGDGDSILQYPALVQAKVAHDRVPRSFDTGVRELRTMITFRGWRSDTRLREEELNTLQQPALFIWGKHDWFGGPDQVQESVELIPDSRLESVDAGHGPWFGLPDTCADLIHEMIS